MADLLWTPLDDRAVDTARDDEYREHMLPASVTARVSVEAGSALSWHRIVGDHGRSISIEHFGASAAGPELLTRFGITAEAVVEAARQTISATRIEEHA